MILLDRIREFSLEKFGLFSYSFLNVEIAKMKETKLVNASLS